MTLRHTALFLITTSIAGMFVACSNDRDATQNGDDPNDPETTVFESDNPSGAGGAKSGGTLASASDSVGTSTGTTTGTAAPSAGTPRDQAAETSNSSGDATRALEEADVVKIDNNRLYALSQYGGLNVIDISQRDNLRLLGRKKVQANPFEMYVRGPVVLALYNGYSEYLPVDSSGSWRYVQTSSVIAFDTTDPANPQIEFLSPLSRPLHPGRV